MALLKDPRAAAEAAAARRAAVLMVSLDQEAAARLMAQLDKPEQERIATEIVRLESSPPDRAEREKILREFTQYHLSQQAVESGGLRTAQSLLEKVHEPQEAKRILANVEAAVGKTPFEFLRKADPENVIGFIADEHPQMIALILSYLEPYRAGRIVEGLPMAKQQEVIRRLATIEPTSPAVVEQVEKALQGRLEAFGAADVRETDGISAAAKVLNHVTRATERSIMEGLKTDEPDLVEKLRRQMFTFVDLGRVNERGIQNLLKTIDTSRLSLALKTASPELRDKFFRNMSKRAQERVLEEMELMGPVRVVDVQAAQNALVDEVLRLEEGGELIVEGRGGMDSVVL
ncbi:MAG TPA: flagellar motor switch protein FliG [Planctomycetota bacterium]|nr:flagellar motor switch protein FliG [Planctomycetota bacterium]